MTAPTTVAIRRGRDLVAPRLFDRLSDRLAADHLFDPDYAERIIDQALAFLAAYGSDPDWPDAPSHTIDLGWHTFLLYTKEYSLFCRQVAGRFIHHVPDDSPTARRSGDDRLTLTIARIKESGYLVDHDLWTMGTTCNPNRCSATGSDGNENTDTIIDDEDD
jgi:hypothetical protein